MKVSIVGAGSVRYSLQLIGDIAKIPELSGVLISLMDINQERLDAIHVLANKYIEELGANVSIEKTNSLDKAIEGSDFVINTALPYPQGHEDGFEKYEIITHIAEKYGYYRGIDSREFNMVSTYSYLICSYYDLKLALEISQLMEKLCPNAWLLQTANPIFEITQYLTRHTNTKIIGFCHGYRGIYRIFETLGLEPEHVDWQVSGVNHGIWLNRFKYKGKNAYPLLDKWIEEESAKWEPNDPWDVQLSPAAIDMYKFYGMIPIGDTVRNGTWKYNYDLETKKKWFGEFGGIDNEVERPKFHRQLRASKQKLIKLAQRVKEDPTVSLTTELPELFTTDRMSGEQQVLFINAIVSNKRTRLVLNIPNRGTIDDIADDIVVETTCQVDSQGVHPEKVEPDLTNRIKKFYLLPRIINMEMALEAFKTRDIRVIEEFLIRDSRTRSYQQVENVLDELLNLPFNREIKEYFAIKREIVKKEMDLST